MPRHKTKPDRIGSLLRSQGVEAFSLSNNETAELQDRWRRTFAVGLDPSLSQSKGGSIGTPSATESQHVRLVKPHGKHIGLSRSKGRSISSLTRMRVRRIGLTLTSSLISAGNPSTYAVTVFRSYASTKEDFVDLLGDGRFQYIQSMFVFGSEDIKGKDGRSHNYWVYNIYFLDGSTFTMRNEMRSGFPKWIMYAGRVNHRPTEQVTEEQKQELWKARADCLVWSGGDACASP